jgi:hypothetical protein
VDLADPLVTEHVLERDRIVAMSLIVPGQALDVTTLIMTYVQGILVVVDAITLGHISVTNNL